MPETSKTSETYPNAGPDQSPDAGKVGEPAGPVDLKELEAQPAAPVITRSTFSCSKTNDCDNCGQSLSKHEDQRYCPSSPPVPTLLEAAEALAPWMSAALSDDGCVQFKQAAESFLEAVARERKAVGK